MDIRKPTSFEPSKTQAEESTATQQTTQTKSATIGSLPASLNVATDLLENKLQDNNPLEATLMAAAENQINPDELPASLSKQMLNISDLANMSQDRFGLGTQGEAKAGPSQGLSSSQYNVPGGSTNFGLPTSITSSLINHFGQDALGSMASKLGSLDGGSSGAGGQINLHSAFAAGGGGWHASSDGTSTSRTTQNKDGSTTTQTNSGQLNDDGTGWASFTTTTNHYGKTTDLHQETASSTAGGTQETTTTDVHTAQDGSTKTTTSSTTTVKNADGSTTTTTTSSTTETNSDGTTKSSSTTTTTTSTPPPKQDDGSSSVQSQPNPSDDPTTGGPRELTDVEKLLEKLRPGILTGGKILQGFTGKGEGGGETVNPGAEGNTATPAYISMEDAMRLAAERKMSLLGNPGSSDLQEEKPAIEDLPTDLTSPQDAGATDPSDGSV